ncbi:hypothetical protein ACFPIF_19495 [Brevundimonas faecalis]|uniref:hypothetical protein n=1 Tax=Brevundimonas faecalis TaxID=947378 RepID=UPI0036219220
MTCAKCAAMAAEVEALRAELEAHSDQPEMERMLRWRRVFDIGGNGAVLVLMELAQQPDRVLSRHQLARASRFAPGARPKPSDLKAKLGDVQVCHLRGRLRQAAVDGRLPDLFAAHDGGIQSHRGVGYSMTEEAALAVRLLAGEVVG